MDEKARRHTYIDIARGNSLPLRVAQFTQKMSQRDRYDRHDDRRDERKRPREDSERQQAARSSGIWQHLSEAKSGASKPAERSGFSLGGGSAQNFLAEAEAFRRSQGLSGLEPSHATAPSPAEEGEVAPSAAEIAAAEAAQQRRAALLKQQQQARSQATAAPANGGTSAKGGSSIKHEKKSRWDEDSDEEEEEEGASAEPAPVAEQPTASQPMPMSEEPSVSSGSTASFIPAERFEGAKPGYAFRNGESGNGYYRDDGGGGPAERMYSHLASFGHVPSIGASADAANEDTWSDRDLNGRTPTPPEVRGSGGGAAAHLDEDEAAVQAVQAENVTEDEEEEGEDGEEEEGEEEEEEDEDEDEDEDAGEEELREQRDCLAHSAGARALVLQGYSWLKPDEHLPIAETGFDALIDRLSDSGGAPAALADAMTDRVAKVADLAADDPRALVLAMLLELECYARVLPASFEADAGAEEKAARGLFKVKV